MASKTVTGTIDGLYQGVSQQPEFRRDDGQSAELINTRCSVAEGLLSRPGSVHVTTLDLPTGATDTEPYIADVLYGLESQPHIITCMHGKLFVTDPDNVTTEADVSLAGLYLNSTDSSKNIYMHRFGEDVIVLNRSVQAAMQADVTPTPATSVLLYVPQVSYDGQYTLYVDDVLEDSYTEPAYADPPVSTTITDTPQSVVATTVSGVYLCSRFAAVLAGLTGVTQISTNCDGTVAQFATTRKVKVLHTASTDDVFVFQDNVQYKEDLPDCAVDGTVLFYTGVDDEESNDHYIKFVKDYGANQGGAWIETLKPGSQYIPSAATLPHRLYKSGSTWKVEPIAWADRKVGGLEATPLPSIFGNTINWVGEMQGRLVMYSGKNYVTTQPVLSTEESYNLFITTLLQALSTDPIDVSPSGSAQNLLWGTMLYSHMIITGRAGQYIVSGAEAIHNANMALVQSSSVQCHPGVAPAVGDERLFFISSKGTKGYSQIVEYQFNATSMKADANSVTKHVPAYIQGEPKQLAVDTVNQMLFVLPQDSKTVYCYEYYGSGDTAQTAWHTWTFSKTVMQITCVDGKLYTITKNPDSLKINVEYIELSGSKNDIDFWNTPAIDSHVALIPELEGGKWVVNLPYTIEETDLPIAVVKDSGPVDNAPVIRMPGVRLTVGYIDSTTIELLQMTAADVAPDQGVLVVVNVGYLYNCEVTPTMPYPLSSYRGIKYIPDDMLYKFMDVFYSNSGPLKFIIDYKGLASITINSEVYILGESKNRIGEVFLQSGKTRVPIGETMGQCQLRILKEDSHLPMAIDHIQWAAKSRSRGVRA